MYTLSDQQTPERFAGQRVTVRGVLYPKTNIIKVETITAQKGTLTIQPNDSITRCYLSRSP